MGDGWYDEPMHPDLDYSRISKQLYVGKTVHSTDYAVLNGLHVQLILNMQAEYYAWASHKSGGIRTIWVPSIDWWLFPIFPWYVMPAVKRALAVINQGGAVYCQCRQGKHRSVLMAACILIAQGRSVEQSVTTLKAARSVADPEAPHIYRGIQAFATAWQRRAG
jgi:hypothetical protein